ncbi:MAG: hypothetical protein HKN82_04005 [Akkermansiaceae bacterium]|nr:hypothetical protein [Akkermansiaceae bacterium]
MRLKVLLLPVLAALGVGFLLTSCATTYDAQGRPVQTVTPEGAALGAVAAGLIGYAIAGDDDDDGHYRHRGHRGHGHRRGHGGYGGYGGYYDPYCR